MPLKSASTLATLAAIAVVGTAQADYVWTGAVDGDWNNAANWNPGVPVSTGGGNLEIINANDKIIFNASASLNPVPTSNIPTLGGYPFGNTRNTPETNVLFGDLTFNLAGFQGGVVGRDTWTTSVGDNSGSDDASLTYVGNFANGINRDSQPNFIQFVVNIDGTLNFDDTDATTTISYGTDRRTEFLIDGGSVNFDAALDVTRNTTALGSSFFDLQFLGSSVTAQFGADFQTLTDVQNATGDGLTFRSSEGLTVSSVDNQDGSFTVFVVPEPSSLALLGLGGLFIARRRRS